MANFKVTPSWNINFGGIIPVYYMGVGSSESEIVNDYLDLRNAICAYVFIQCVNKGSENGGIEFNLKREYIDGVVYGRTGEESWVLQPSPSTSKTIASLISTGSRSILVSDTSGLSIDSDRLDNNAVALFSETYRNNFECHKISQIKTGVIKLDSPVSYQHKINDIDVDVVYNNIMCLDPILLPGGALYNITFRCLPPSSSYLVRWYANIYTNDVVNRI